MGHIRAGSLHGVGPVGLRQLLQRHRRRIAALTAALVCTTALAVHHSGLAVGDAHHDTGMSAAVEMCLAAFTAVGAAVVAVALGLIALGRWRPPLRMTPAALTVATYCPLPRARPGPALLLLLCVSRR